MKKLLLSSFFTIIILMIITSNNFCQTNIYSEAPIFIENGIRKSTQLTLNFKYPVFNVAKGICEAAIPEESIQYPKIIHYLNNLRKKYGPIKLLKKVPDAEWGDVWRKNASGIKVKIHEMSQLFALVFGKTVPIDSIIANLKTFEEIDYAECPVSVVTFAEPNDYSQSEQWYLNRVNAVKAWDITKGSRYLYLSIIDPTGVYRSHPDLDGKFDTQFGINYITNDHGTLVAGVAGANTNNGIGIASLGWNMGLRSDWGPTQDDKSLATAIYNAKTANSCKVIIMCFGTVETESVQNCDGGSKNCSRWITKSYSEVSEAIWDIVMEDKILIVAATGDAGLNSNNSSFCSNCTSDFTTWNPYPAKYSGVLAVGATDENDSSPADYNHGDFILVCAPGKNIKTTTLGVSGDYTYANYGGTSLSAPMVGALAGLIFSINPSLPAHTVSEIITTTSVDLGASGKDPLYGFGRIDAYKALKYTLENYGGVLTQNLTIPAGETWNFKSGITVTFQNGASLVVNGSLNANGATFDFISGNSAYTNGIKLLSGSTASIFNSTIKNAYQGINLNHAYLSMSGCYVTGCSNHGINMYDENGVSNRSVISDNYIYSNTGSGIVLYYSSPVITGNHIYSNYYGMGLSDYSAPQLGYLGAYGYNHIYSNRCHGLSAQRNSNPFLGENICIENGGHNKIENNTPYNVSVYGNSIVTAENNWWEYLSDNVTINASKFYVSSGAFDYYPPADPEDPARYYKPDPNIIHGLPSDKSSPEEMLYDRQFTSSSSGSQSKEGISENQITYAGKDTLQGNAEAKAPSCYDEKWPLLKKLTYARYMHFLNKDLEAEEICKKVIESFPDSLLSYYALDILWQSTRKSRIEDFKSYLNIIKSHLDRKPVSLMAEILLARFEKENRIKLLDELSDKVKNMPPKDISPSARQGIMESLLFSKLLHYLNDENNVSKAKDMVSEIDALVGIGSHSSVEAHMLIGDDIAEENLLTKDLNSSEESAAIEKPTEYSLSDNYPNPFNPSTRIDYTLPMTSKVELKIYDILGHEVATLVNTIHEAGRYSTMFNASNVSSGLYIYKIRSHSLENGRVFEKTGKMMFMK